jgi:hypothetical protein
MFFIVREVPRVLAAALLLVALITVAPSYGQESETQELAKAVQNPVSSLISVPFQNNTNFGIGPQDRNQNVLNIQPVIPFTVGKWNIINRTIAPIVYQPDFSQSSGATSGLGDINHTVFFSPARASRFIWGAGPIVSFRTATDDALGTDKWGAGPSAVVLTTTGPWVAGALVNNIWSFAGDSERSDVNRFLLQYFINYNLPRGWYIVSAPVITANWEADSGNRWLVPFGGGIGKIFRVGSQPLNGSAHVYYNAIHPDEAPYPGWTLRLQLQFLFPKR